MHCIAMILAQKKIYPYKVEGTVVAEKMCDSCSKLIYDNQAYFSMEVKVQWNVGTESSEYEM